jgi:hypothetical protein
MAEEQRRGTQFQAQLEDDVCIHVFRASANMLGVCLTVLGLFRLLGGPQEIKHIGNALLLVAAMAFLISCTLSYIALRTRGNRRRLKIERTADAIFLSALCLMAIVCGLLAYEFV